MRPTRALFLILVLSGLAAAAGEPVVPALPSAPKAETKSALGELAASMEPGTFALLNQDGDASGYSWDGFLKGGGPDSAAVGSIFGYAQKAAYDPVEDKVYFKGAPHYQGRRNFWATHITYDVGRNRWTAVAPILAPVGHAYDSNAIDVGAREFYASATLANNKLRRFHLQTGQWTDMAQPESTRAPVGEPSVEYFSERDELLMLQGSTLSCWKRTTDMWKRVAELDGLYFRSAILRYNPVHQCVLIMGGADTNSKPAKRSRAVYKLAADGTVTRLKDGPASICVYVNQSLSAVDPAAARIACARVPSSTWMSTAGSSSPTSTSSASRCSTPTAIRWACSAATVPSTRRAGRSPRRVGPRVRGRRPARTSRWPGRSPWPSPTPTRT
jgi:hypothetical protein